MTEFKLYDTAAKTITPVPNQEGRVTIYSCGPTVYDRPTIGNLRTMLFYDWVSRALRWAGYEVERTMNYTDVGHLASDADEGEDKLAKRAQERKKTAWEIAAEMIQIFDDDAQSLGIIPPDHLLRATDEIPAMIGLVQKLVDKGVAYTISDGVYFDTTKFPTYGQLAHLDIAGQKEGARVETNPEKRHATDFALWKFSPKDVQRDMEWDSPWGKGFPGWHIECSAMAMKTLGETIDLHLGGVDLLPVHHENEVAQSEAATGKQFVRLWVHGEHLLIDGQRMGKSLGNAYTLDDLIAKGFDPLDFRYFCALAHYRQKENFTWEALTAAQTARQRLANKVSTLPEDSDHDESFMNTITEVVANDLDLPGVVATIWKSIGSDKPCSRAALLEVDRKLLGFGLAKAVEIPLTPELEELVKKRAAAREGKDWAAADEIRQQLLDQGVEIEDTPNGSKIIYQPTND